MAEEASVAEAVEEVAEEPVAEETADEPTAEEGASAEDDSAEAEESKKRVRLLQHRKSLLQARNRLRRLRSGGPSEGCRPSNRRIRIVSGHKRPNDIRIDVRGKTATTRYRCGGLGFRVAAD